ncbi:MAG TPA: 4Fe-4S dicluster domain-containing protein [Candidatus Lokiarchaeia archaeon]|nr:4Fe-4S dicluster domain-containing protein [Candidatus Lokiarchaeia archaeon]
MVDHSGGIKLDDVAIYRALQQHLNEMPVRYPKTKNGSDLKLLRSFFTLAEAKIALSLDYKYRSVAEICSRLGEAGISPEELEQKLDIMAGKGIFCSESNGEKNYALVPFLTGMFEMKVNNLSPELISDVLEFLPGGFALEYLTTSIPQMRIIPVEEAIEVTHAIANYDELEALINNADRICVTECICKKIGDMRDIPCSRTSRREICLYFRKYAETFLREHWGREITKEEALEIARQNEQDGLILQPSNDQNPQGICACCSCCCGILSMLKVLPKPAKLVASNYFAEADSTACKGCNTCVKRCHMSAITVANRVARVDLDRCIGCGLCVSTCKPKAMHLVKKQRESVPPESVEIMYENIMQHKKGLWGKIKMVLNQNPIKLIKNLKNAS